MTEQQTAMVREFARQGAKQELQRILGEFPDLLKEIPRVQRIAQAYHARAIKRVKGSHGRQTQSGG